MTASTRPAPHTGTPQERWMKGYYAELVGMTIVGVTITPDEFGGEPWLSIIAEKDNENGDIERFTLAVSQDEEGNGPGFVFGLPEYTLPEYRS